MEVDLLLTAETTIAAGRTTVQPNRKTRADVEDVLDRNAIHMASIRTASKAAVAHVARRLRNLHPARTRTAGPRLNAAALGPAVSGLASAHASLAQVNDDPIIEPNVAPTA